MLFNQNQIISVLVFGALFSADGAFSASYGSVSWEEKDSRIRYDTVCNNYGYGSIESRSCRSDAAKFFIAQCKSVSGQYEKASYSARSRYKKLKNKYCHAARHFKIVD